MRTKAEICARIAEIEVSVAAAVTLNEEARHKAGRGHYTDADLEHSERSITQGTYELKTLRWVLGIA